jgi:hypothetical protein
VLFGWSNVTEQTEVPADLTPGPNRDALELANKAKFTVAELQTYEKAGDEIRQAHEIAEARWAEGMLKAKREIVAPRVEALDAPSEAASVVSEMGRGAAVCVLDEANYAGVVHRRPGWLAIRLPGSSGVGYVRIEAIDLAAASPTADPSCGGSAPVSTTPATVSGAPATAPATALLFPQRWGPQTSEPSPVQARTPLNSPRYLPEGSLLPIIPPGPYDLRSNDCLSVWAKALVRPGVQTSSPGLQPRCIFAHW